MLIGGMTIRRNDYSVEKSAKLLLKCQAAYLRSNKLVGYPVDF